VTTDAGANAAKAALGRGNALFHGPRWRESRAEYETALQLFEGLGDTARMSVADVTCNLASVAWRLSDFHRADHLYDRARDLYVGLGKMWHVAKVEQYQGNVAYDRGDLHRARWLYERARLGLLDGGGPLDVADVDVNLAALLGELADRDRALELLDEATGLYTSELTGDRLELKLAETDQNRGLIHMEAGRLARAWRNLARAVKTQHRHGDQEKVADLLHNLANVAVRMHRSTTAQTLYRRAIEIYDTFGDDRSESADCRLGLGAMFRRDGEPDTARHLLQQAAATYTATGEWLALARASHNVALTQPEDPPARAAGLARAWLAMQSITWGLPEVAARADWRTTLDDATAATLAAAVASNDLLLAAEVIEAMRSTPLAPTATIPAGISPSGTTVHDLPVIRPAAVDCGWAPRLTCHLDGAERIRNASGTSIRLRTSTVGLPQLLTP
jgi:tetratricopeptide (TPR) repeat protein